MVYFGLPQITKGSKLKNMKFLIIINILKRKKKLLLMNGKY